MLAQDLHAYRALARDHIRVVVGVDERQAAFSADHARMCIGFVVRVAMQLDDGTTRLHRVDLDLRRGDGHHDGRAAVELLRGERDPLRVIASGCRDHAAP